MTNLKTFMSTFNRHAPQRKRCVGANNSPFMNKPLSKAIMVRTRLRNKFLKSKTNESREAYKKQRNYCISLLRETKRCFYENLNPEFISDNKKFWMQVKPFFSDKTPPNSKIMLVGEEIISDSSKCAELMNNFFSDAAINLDIDRELNTEIVPDGINDPGTKASGKYKCHPSIIKIEEQGFMVITFNFLPISILDMHNEICNLDTSKAYQKDNIPPKLLKDNNDMFHCVIL